MYASHQHRHHRRTLILGSSPLVLQGQTGQSWPRGSGEPLWMMEVSGRCSDAILSQCHGSHEKKPGSQAPVQGCTRTAAQPGVCCSCLKSVAQRQNRSWVHSLILQILDVVGQRLVSGFRKKEDSEAREDGYDSIDDPRQRFKICS